MNALSLVSSYIFSSLEGSDDKSFREAGERSNVDRRALEASRINKSRPACADLKPLSSVRIERGENSMLLPSIYYPRPWRVVVTTGQCRKFVKMSARRFPFSFVQMCERSGRWTHRFAFQ